MKNVMKKVFSLFLVGVVAVSIFGFVAPTRAEAVGENSRGIVKLANNTNCKALFKVKFYNKNFELIVDRYAKLEANDNNGANVFTIPDNTEFILVDVKKKNTDSFTYVDTLKFEMSYSKACSEDVIKVAYTEIGGEKLLSECTGGWEQI